MNYLELAKIASELNTQGLDHAVLKMPAPKFRGNYPIKVRSPFGLVKWYPSNQKDTVIIFVTANQIQKFLKKELKND